MNRRPFDRSAPPPPGSTGRLHNRREWLWFHSACAYAPPSRTIEFISPTTHSTSCRVVRKLVTHARITGSPWSSCTVDIHAICRLDKADKNGPADSPSRVKQTTGRGVLFRIFHPEDASNSRSKSPI